MMRPCCLQVVKVGPGADGRIEAGRASFMCWTPTGSCHVQTHLDPRAPTTWFRSPYPVCLLVFGFDGLFRIDGMVQHASVSLLRIRIRALLMLASSWLQPTERVAFAWAIIPLRHTRVELLRMIDNESVHNSTSF